MYAPLPPSAVVSPAALAAGFAEAVVALFVTP
jgi:hypothetical protein